MTVNTLLSEPVFSSVTQETVRYKRSTNSEDLKMKKVIATLIAGLFASAAFAQQAPAPAAPAAPASKEVKAEVKQEAKQEVKQEAQKPAAEKK
ncbi:hypothetical protein [Pseudoduganella sp.]|uniref:hypothetical protein n=1 Tax=Pseudoduganella sp. TaxID=1880898 RepID=UPI0035B057E3